MMLHLFFSALLWLMKMLNACSTCLSECYCSHPKLRNTCPRVSPGPSPPHPPRDQGRLRHTQNVLSIQKLLLSLAMPQPASCEHTLNIMPERFPDARQRLDSTLALSWPTLHCLTSREGRQCQTLRTRSTGRLPA